MMVCSCTSCLLLKGYKWIINDINNWFYHFRVILESCWVLLFVVMLCVIVVFFPFPWCSSWVSIGRNGEAIFARSSPLGLALPLPSHWKHKVMPPRKPWFIVPKRHPLTIEYYGILWVSMDMLDPLWSQLPAVGPLNHNFLLLNTPLW